VDAMSVLQATGMAVGLIPTTRDVNTRAVPDWLVVVQQDFDEGVALANRMKYNIVLLVAIGIVGLLVIAKLWWDSALA